MTAKPLVSISVLSYSEKPGVIGAALRSAALQSYPALEIIVGDNAFSPEHTKTAERLLAEVMRERKEKLQFSAEHRFIANGENLSFARGHNKNILLSRGEFVLLLNADAILDKNFIALAVQKFAEDKKVAALQGKLVRFNFIENRPVTMMLGGIPHPVIDTTGLLILKNRRIVNRGQGEADAGQYGREEEVFGADGAAPVYRREALEDVKICLNSPSTSLGVNCEYLDEDFFYYKEDVDLAWRLRLYGWKTLYVPAMRAWHGRTAGESAARNYFSIIQERRKIAKDPKFYSFKNQRLMQAKNELPVLVLKHLPQLLVKEIGSWGYVAVFERTTLKSIRLLLKQIPRAWRKRRIIMAKRRVGAGEMEKWFR